MSLCEGFALQWTWYWLYACLFRKWHPSYYNLGMVVLAYLDTAMGGPDGPLPDPRRYKETVLAHLRISSMGVPTTTANLDSLMEKFLDGSAPAVQQGPAVFPQFTAQDTPEGQLIFIFPALGWLLILRPGLTKS